MEIISAKYLVSMEGDPIFDGAMAIENGEIMDVGTEQDLLKRYPSATHEDHANYAILPGLINAHTHLDMTLHQNFKNDPVRTTLAQVNFIDWLLSCIDYKKNNSHQRLREAVIEGANNCLESGTTCVADMGSFDGIFQSLEQTGLRAVIFPEVLSFDSQVAKDLFETALSMVDRYADSDCDKLTVGMGPFSPYMLSRNILRIMSLHSKSAQIPLMIHAAESFSEMEFFYNSTGDIATRLFPNIGWGDNLPPAHHKTPIAYLDDIDFLSAKPILVGCVHATEEDLGRIQKHGAKVVWCPRSQDYLKLGRAPILMMKQKGIVTALGTNGISSVNTLSLWDEMRFAYELHGGRGLTGHDILRMTTLDAATVLGLEDETGSLKIGKRADYILVDLKDISEQEDLYSQLILHTRNYHIHRVVVDGEIKKQIN